MTPEVSIIIPTYNRGHIISKTLGSILDQTYSNWECIIVDDGSEDSTSDVVNQYSHEDARFKYVVRPNERPKGANACRNYGFELSRGKYINFFDDDDIMLPTKMEQQIKSLENSSCYYCICQTMMFDGISGKNLGLRAPNIVSDNIFDDYINFKSFWLTGAPLWKKDFLLENKLAFDEELQQGQDYDFHMRVLDISTNYVAIQEHLVLFGEHETNMSLSAIDTPLKVYSNAKIKYNILNKYKSKLKADTLHSNYRELLALYKFAVRHKQYKNSFFIFKTLIINISALKCGFLKKMDVIFKLVTSMFLFTIFGKGERFLRFKV